MCGLAGVIHWDREGVAEANLRSMSALLHHRGPDESGIAVPSAGVGLAHTRLRVIDLSEAARQPMTNEAGAAWICFNGEIYNFRELRRQLEAVGVAFRSRSDTEVLLRAIETWGPDALTRLEGMFAIAFWDEKKREMILARDRSGKKPLYYWTDGRCLAFGSEIKALFAHPHVPRRMEESVLPALLTFGYPPAGQTCYAQIRQIQPATWSRFSADQPAGAHTRYWTLPFSEEKTPAPSVSQSAAELRRLLTEAVTRRLISDVPLGAFLSGGLDSTLVVALMSAQTERPVKTFSIGFEGDSRYNETSFARLAAARYRTDHTEFIVKPQPFELLDRIVWHLDQPFGDSSVIPTYLLCELTRAQVTVALNGDGGDELFAGYDRFRAALLAEKIPAPLKQLGRRWTRSRPPAARERTFGSRFLRFLETAAEPFDRRFLRWNSYFVRPEEILTAGIPPSGPEPSLGNGGPAGPLERLLRFNFEQYLPNDLHVKMDRCSMAHGLETRSPFLDTALVEWAFRLPGSLKLRNGTTKWILRRAFRELIPPEILRRSKMGFGVPLGTWFRTSWRSPLEETRGSPQARTRRYVRPAALRQLIDRHLGGGEDLGQRLWLLLSFELWLRQLEQPVALDERSALVIK